MLNSQPYSCGAKAYFKRPVNKYLLTVVGEIDVSRRYYRCKKCGAGCLPLDDWAGLLDGDEYIGGEADAEPCGNELVIRHRVGSAGGIVPADGEQRHNPESQRGGIVSEFWTERAA